MKRDAVASCNAKLRALGGGLNEVSPPSKMKEDIEQFRKENDASTGDGSAPLTRENDKTPDMEFGRARDNTMT